VCTVSGVGSVVFLWSAGWVELGQVESETWRVALDRVEQNGPVHDKAGHGHSHRVTTLVLQHITDRLQVRQRVIFNTALQCVEVVTPRKRYEIVTLCTDH